MYGIAEARTDKTNAAWSALRDHILDDILWGERNRNGWATARHVRELLEADLWNLIPDPDFVAGAFHEFTEYPMDKFQAAVRAIYQKQVEKGSSDYRTRRNLSRRIWSEHPMDLGWMAESWLVN